MHRVLYLTDEADPIAPKVLRVAEGRLAIETSMALSADTGDFDALLIGDSGPGQLLEQLSADGPRFVQLTRGHHVQVDAKSLADAGVPVAGASPVLAPYVARHAASLAAAALSAPEVIESRPALDMKSVFENIDSAFRGKTVGVVGFGRVGRATVDLCKLLGARVIYSDVRTAPHGSAAAAGVRRSTLDLLLSRSDIVSLHVQWGPTSNPLLAERELRLMSNEAVLVNTADGRLIDDEALAAALKAGRIRAAMDIEDIESTALTDAPVAASTGYTAARSGEADEKVAEFVVANIETALSGGEPGGLIEIVDYPPIGDPAFWSTKMSPRVP